MQLENRIANDYTPEVRQALAVLDHVESFVGVDSEGRKMHPILVTEVNKPYVVQFLLGSWNLSGKVYMVKAKYRVELSAEGAQEAIDLGLTKRVKYGSREPTKVCIMADTDGNIAELEELAYAAQEGSRNTTSHMKSDTLLTSNIYTSGAELLNRHNAEVADAQATGDFGTAKDTYTYTTETLGVDKKDLAKKTKTQRNYLRTIRD